MNTIKIYVEQLLFQTGLSSELIPIVRHIVLVLVTIALAWMAGWVCKLFIPLIIKVTQRTEAKWDDALFNERVLRSVCQIVPAIVIYSLLPSVFFEFQVAHEVLAQLTAIYITVMATRSIITFADSLSNLQSDHHTARQQYLYTFIGVLKIILIFIAVIVVTSIVIKKDPSTLLAGLGAVSAILMLAFQDTIKGVVAGIRLTSNEMVSIGDRITVPAAGADGIVEEIRLTTVKVRNFDNTIITVSPTTLVDGSFQNWKGMKENVGRKVVRKLYMDFRSITVDDEGMVNLTRYRLHMEKWLKERDDVLSDLLVMVHQLDATPTGLPVEFVFWLKMQDVLPYEHAISEIMEYACAEAPVFGLTIYQQFPEQ